MNDTSQKKLSEVYPVLQSRVKDVEAAWSVGVLDATLEISQGLRTWNLQAAYYSQGRDSLPQVNDQRRAVGLLPISLEDNEYTVTNAPPGYSNHEYGFAVDFDIQINGGSLDWDGNDVRWRTLLALAAPNKLRSGSCWGDRPHMELIEVPEKPTPEMIYVLKNQGIATVWGDFTIT